LGLSDSRITPSEKGEIGEKYVQRLLKDPFYTVTNVAKGQGKQGDLTVSFNREKNVKVGTTSE
jgi:hypothetical protein